MKEITKYPLFGKQNLVDPKDNDFGFGDVGWRYGGCISYPAIGESPKTTEVKVYNNTPVRIFSNGSEFDEWHYNNCNRCKKCGEARDPDHVRELRCCGMELRIAIAFLDDGKIPFKTVRRIGYSSISIQRNGVFARLTKCKEFLPKQF